ncbi:MAG TPA: hypothetical protein VD973_28005 [Symbiobacteriaceae bacterium]|nr:hypothetical protein [Symbiobacteriaceae bacterium]
MEIILAPERVFQLLPQVTPDLARARAEEKKTSLVAGMLGNLFARPRPDDIPLIATQCRWEPFWQLTIRVRTVYDRQGHYNVPVGGPEVKWVTTLGQTLAVDSLGRAGPGFTLTAVEHCHEDTRNVRTLSGAGAAMPECLKLVDMPKAEIWDLGVLQGEGVVCVPPDLSSGALIRQLMPEMVRPVKAQVIHEEQVILETIDLYFRPFYAFEYHWTAKGKRAIIDCDGLSGEIRLGGPSLKDQVRKILSRDMLFDISAEAAGAVLPGAGIAVKLTKAAMDLKR